jgi:integrase/recombinase XerD
MLENYYVRPATVDCIRASCIVPAIEQYVNWMAEHRYTPRSVLRRLPVLMEFGEFAKTRGVNEFVQLINHIEPFVQAWIRRRARGRSASRRSRLAHEIRNPICQMLRLAIDGNDGPGRPHKPENPFERQALSSWRTLSRRRAFAHVRSTSTASTFDSSSLPRTQRQRPARIGPNRG